MTEKRELGNRGEEAVALFLEKKGFVIRARQFACKRGEIDIIAERGDLIVFVEVKTRRSVYFPIASVVNYAKQRKMVQAARWYVMTQRIEDRVLRFDVASVIAHDDEQIKYIENAFVVAR